MHVRESRLRDALRLLVWIPGRAAAARLPERVAFRAFESMGLLHAAASPGRIHSLAGRMALTGLPERELAAAAREHVRNHYADRLHILLYPRIVPRRVRPPWLEIEGRHHLDGALAAGKGAVVVHPHYAVPQLLPLALGLEGYRCLQIGLPSDEGLSDIGRSVAFRSRMELEALLPARILNADGFLRDAFRHLREGGVVLVTGDGTGGRRFRGRHEPIPLLGRRVLLPVGPAKLALATGAPLLTGLVERLGPGRYRAALGAPLLPVTEGDGDPALALTRSFAAWLEARLRRAPAPWHFWDDMVEDNMIVPGPASP